MAHCHNGSLAQYECPVPLVPNQAPLLVPSGSKRGVVIQLHGLETSAPNLPTPIQTGAEAGLASALQTDGWVVLYPVEPGDYGLPYQASTVAADINNDTNDGLRQLTTILLWWDHVVLWVQKTYGNWPIVVMGNSWGGFIALSVAIHRTSTIIAYCPSHPASQPDKINPATVVINNSSGMDVGSTALNALGNGWLGSVPPGILTWGTIDTTVDYPNSGDLLTPAIYTAASGAGQPVSPSCNGSGNSSGGTPEGHPLTTTDAATIEAWFTSTVDPLAPKVH